MGASTRASPGASTRCLLRSDASHCRHDDDERHPHFVVCPALTDDNQWHRPCCINKAIHQYYRSTRRQNATTMVATSGPSPSKILPPSKFTHPPVQNSSNRIQPCWERTATAPTLRANHHEAAMVWPFRIGHVGQCQGARPLIALHLLDLEAECVGWQQRLV